MSGLTYCPDSGCCPETCHALTEKKRSAFENDYDPDIRSFLRRAIGSTDGALLLDGIYVR